MKRSREVPPSSASRAHIFHHFLLATTVPRELFSLSFAAMAIFAGCAAWAAKPVLEPTRTPVVDSSAEYPDGSSDRPAIDFYGLPWTGSGPGELRIKGPRSFWISMMMPYDGKVSSIRQYLVGRGTCSYGCGDGGVIQFGVHRDDNGTPGPEVTFAAISESRIAAMRANTGGRFDDTPLNESLTVSRGERIWFSASNLHSDPTQNYISINPLNMNSRNRTQSEPVTSLDPDNRQLTVFDGNLDLIPWKQHVFAVTYVDGRSFGNGYVSGAPHATHGGIGDKWAPAGGSQKVRQRFTPDRDLVFESVDLRLYLASGLAPLTVTIRQGGTVVATGLSRAEQN